MIQRRDNVIIVVLNSLIFSLVEKNLFNIDANHEERMFILLRLRFLL